MLEIPQRLKKEMFDLINKRLISELEEAVYPGEIATKFNSILNDEFKNYSLYPVFVGEYGIDPNSPQKTRVVSHQGTKACSPLKIIEGIIGRAIRTGKDQYVPDVTKDPDHVGCDPTMEGSELVLLSWSEPSIYGNKKIPSIPLGVLDIDLNIKNALTKYDRQRLRAIWDIYGKFIFPGKLRFEAPERVYNPLPYKRNICKNREALKR